MVATEEDQALELEFEYEAIGSDEDRTAELTLASAP